MTGILILAHGSRQKDTERTLEALVQKVGELTGVTNIDFAFLQFSENLLAAGLDRLVKKGCNNIHVIPYFLFDGVHVREDIPAALAEYHRANPGVRLHLGKTLGTDERLAAILADQIQAVIQ